MSTGSHEVARRRLQLRWGDFDLLGHLNQAVYHELLEEGRVALLAAAGTHSLQFVLARVELDYRTEIPSSHREVTVETGVEQIGRSSVRLLQRVVRTDGAVAAEGISVIVGWDGEARASRPLSDAERSALARYATPSVASS
jgi:acyl-CoA thioester hydrolase